MSKCIDAEQLEKDGWTMQRTYKSSATEMVCEMKTPTDFPAADVAEVKHGRWIERPSITYDKMECSVCGFEYDYSEFTYCPNCGARMDGGAE